MEDDLSTAWRLPDGFVLPAAGFGPALGSNPSPAEASPRAESQGKEQHR
jgi:hypothetical protein